MEHKDKFLRDCILPVYLILGVITPFYNPWWFSILSLVIFGFLLYLYYIL